MKAKRKCIVIILITVIVLGLFIILITTYHKAYNVNPLSDNIIKSYNIEDCNNLMIVAHPDDETLWGGKELLSGDWAVVCITSENNKTRYDEFMSVMDYCGCKGIMLSYPDKVLFKRDSWKKVRSQLTGDISLIINYKKWNKIVTHNPDGEYGHQHHKMTSEIVTQVCKGTDNQNKYDRLYYFEKYLTQEDIDKNIDYYDKNESLDSDIENMLSLYTSQKNTVNKLKHIIDYQKIIKANEWR